jgi:hypothetical protein
VAVADAFISCWRVKFEQPSPPVTYIKRHIDPKWEPLLITPPFPEYPSGHSSASRVRPRRCFDRDLRADFAFDDATHEDEGLPVRSFPFQGGGGRGGDVAALWRHPFPLWQRQGPGAGRCIGAHAAALKA